MSQNTARSDIPASAAKLTVVPNAVAVPQKPQPLYLSIRSRIREKISNGELTEGAVIKEGLLASVFGVSRAPVRHALHLLEESKHIRSADGQGFLVGLGSTSSTVTMQELRALFVDHSELEVGRAPAWEGIYDSILLDVSNCLPFGTFRVSETLACEFFSIGRTTLRDGLSKLQEQGLLEKSKHSHWIAGPLTARDIHEAYFIRTLLEPAAFVQSTTSINKEEVLEMRDRILATVDNLENIQAEDVERIQGELHAILLKNTKNRRLLEAIERTRFPFIVNRIFRRNFGLQNDLAMLEAYVEILTQLLKGHSNVARAMLEAHLERATKNTLAKLRVLSILPKPISAPYLINIH